MSGFRQIAVVGVGLIGGSLATALRRKTPQLEVVGIDRRSVIDEALAAGILSRGEEIASLESAISDADAVFLCTPIREILRLLPAAAQAVKSGALVTDVGSTKRRIVETADRVFPKDRFFIGGHPMAGAEGRGLKWADALLFENAVYALTPSSGLPPDLMKEFGSLLESIGSKILLLTPVLHDKIAAAVSHLPQLLAVTLMNLVAERQKDSPHFLKLAAGGFRDMTRIASSPYELWEPVVETNRTEILAFLDAFSLALGKMRESVEKSDLKKSFQNAARNRLSIPKDTKGFLRPHFDLLVRVEDKPGVIASIAGALAERAVNIKDIEILKVREGDAGTLRLAFETPEARQTAISILEGAGFGVKIRD
jgi:prephenate dehydrogenase